MNRRAPLKELIQLARRLGVFIMYRLLVFSILYGEKPCMHNGF